MPPIPILPIKLKVYDYKIQYQNHTQGTKLKTKNILYFSQWKDFKICKWDLLRVSRSKSLCYLNARNRPYLLTNFCDNLSKSKQSQTIIDTYRQNIIWELSLYMNVFSKLVSLWHSGLGILQYLCCTLPRSTLILICTVKNHFDSHFSPHESTVSFGP